MKTILVTPNERGDGTTAFARDLSVALASLKQPSPSVVALDYAGGELWRQAKRQDGFTAYPSEVFYAAWSVHHNRSRQTMPANELNKTQSSQLESAIKGDIDYLVIDARSATYAAVDMVLLVARCDIRNLATLRSTYQRLTGENPNTHIVLVQGSSHGQTGLMTDTMRSQITKKGVKALRANGAPLVIPQNNEAYIVAAREGLPVFRIPESDKITSDDLYALRSAHHEAAVEVRRILRRADVGSSPAPEAVAASA